MQEEEKSPLVQTAPESELQQNGSDPNDPSPHPSAFTVSCFEWVGSLVMALVTVVILFTSLFRVVTVDGTSMLPNLYSRDGIMVSSYFYQPKQGDMVVLKRITGLTKSIVKRVIALSRQTVSTDYITGTVSVDGEGLDKPTYIENGTTHGPMTSESLLQFPQTVPAGHISVLGDDREVSEDNRFEAVGMMDERYILGKAELVLFPVSQFGKIGS